MSEGILVGYDPRTGDRAPVRFGVAIARLVEAPLIVGSVYSEAAVGEALEDLRRELQAEGVRAECRPLPGASTPAALHRAADSLGAGLLVVGSSSRGPVSRAVGGATAERILRGAPCPVAVVPFEWEEGAGLRTIAVAATDSTQEQSAVRSAEALIARTGAKPRVLRVEADASAQDAAEPLIDASHDLDLLVCAPRGVAPRVIAAAQCPVIVPAPGGPGRASSGQRVGTTPTTRVPLPTSER